MITDDIEPYMHNEIVPGMSRTFSQTLQACEIDYNTGYSFAPRYNVIEPHDTQFVESQPSQLCVDHDIYNPRHQYDSGLTLTDLQPDKLYDKRDQYVPSFEKEMNSYKFFHDIMHEPKADLLKTEIEERGGSMGFFNISLVWDNTDDLDLSVTTPSGETIYFGARVSKCGGRLDIDANANYICTKIPIENIYWDDIPPNGKYKIIVTNYNSRNTAKTPFRCLVRYKNIIKAFDGVTSHKESVTIFDDVINFD